MRCGTRRRIGGAEDETYYSFKMRQKLERVTTPLNNLSIKFYSHISATIFWGTSITLSKLKGTL